MGVLIRAAFGAAALVLALTLVACGDSEPDQRKAFIAFLQDINGRSGAHYLVPTPTDEKAFGPYLAHYALFMDFNKDMKTQVDEFTAAIVKLGAGPGVSPRTIEQMVAAPADLTTVKSELTKTWQTLEARVARATADRAALKQPDDLKAAYDKTFDKLVTAPALAFQRSEQALQEGVDASVKLVEYINSHRTRLAVSGMQIQAKDQRTLDEIAPLIRAHQEAGARFAAAQRDAERLMGR